MSVKNWIKGKINSLPHVRSLVKEVETWRKYSRVPPGHFYSPIVAPEEIKQKEEQLWPEPLPATIEAIDLNITRQKELLKAFEAYYNEIPFQDNPKEGLRFYFKNVYYSYTDALVLHSFMRHIQPKKIIEMGSGYSSAVMLDTNERFFDNSIQLTFIEPYPDRLNTLLKASDKASSTLLCENAQNVPLSKFRELEEGDILFIDSTHVMKTGSDVNYILFEILPCLKKGVFIHFHDVFYPFEYPKKWVYQGRNWNEIYGLRAFLMYNNAFEIQLFSHYMHKVHPDSFAKMPMAYKNVGGNFWLRKK